MTPFDIDRLERLFSLAMRINAAGKYHCFVHVAAHVSEFEVYLTPADDYTAVLWRFRKYYAGYNETGFSQQAVRAVAVLEDVLHERDVTRHFAKAAEDVV